ncbi:unnamed protein product [Cunninghamella echinulata]
MTVSYAANGDLIINDHTYSNPSGCYNIEGWPLIVTNSADIPATIYDASYCRGTVVGAVYPKQKVVIEFGASVFIS